MRQEIDSMAFLRNCYERQLILRAVICVVCLSIMLSIPCAAEDYSFEEEPKRVALVIGNEIYKNLESIGSSRPDAEIVAKHLRELGFDVDRYFDVKTLKDFEFRILPEFAKKVTDGAFVIFYFSGHGFSHGPHNFLAPTEIPISIREGEVTRHAISVEAFEDYMIGLSPGVMMFFIDACRSIPGFVVKDERGGNVVRKGFTMPVQYNVAINSLVAYATKPGKISMGSSEPGQLSVFTQSISDHISAEGLPFGTVFDEIAAQVTVSTDSEQVPGLYDWSQTDPYLKPTARNLEEQKEFWLSTLQTGSLEKVRIFALRYSVSRHAAAARKWLTDNRDNDRANRFTLASPLAVDRAWDPTFDGTPAYSIRRLALPFAFDRSVKENQNETLQAFTDPEIGLVPSGTSPQEIARDSLAFSLANIDAHGTVVATQNLLARTEPSISAHVVQRIPFGTQLKISSVTFGTDKSIWVSASTPGQTSSFYIKIEPGTTPFPLELGQSLKQIIVQPRSNSIPELVDPLPLEKTIADLKARGWKITWVSLSTARTDDELEQVTRESWIVNSEYILKRAGIDGRRITSVSGRDDFAENGVRVRFFGIPQNE